MEELILAYELNLLNPEFCSNRENIEKLISKDFMEYGKSGQIYTQQEVIEFLLSCKERDVKIKKFRLEYLNENVLLAHYISTDNINGTQALRTSIWKSENNLWRMYFHQGTAIN